MASGLRIDGLHFKAAIGEIQRHAILHEPDAAPLEGALDAGAADGEAGFIRTEARLHEHTRSEIQRILQRDGPPAQVVLRIHDRRAASRGGSDLLLPLLH